MRTTSGLKPTCYGNDKQMHS